MKRKNPRQWWGAGKQAAINTSPSVETVEPHANTVARESSVSSSVSEGNGEGFAIERAFVVNYKFWRWFRGSCCAGFRPREAVGLICTRGEAISSARRTVRLGRRNWSSRASSRFAFHFRLNLADLSSRNFISADPIR